MENRANVAKSYRLRMLLVAIFCFAFMSWFIYDGAIGYPAQAVRANKYLDLQESGRENWQAEWEQLAIEKGWPTADPGKPKTSHECSAQFLMAGVMLLVAIPFLYIYFSTRGIWIEIDDDGFFTSWGQRCDFDDITLLDKKKWYNKGIAVIHYEENGKQRKLALDDCKYDRDVTEYFVHELELEIDEEQIVGKRPGEVIEQAEGGEGSEEATLDEDNASNPA